MLDNVVQLSDRNCKTRFSCPTFRRYLPEFIFFAIESLNTRKTRGSPNSIYSSHLRARLRFALIEAVLAELVIYEGK